MSGADNLRRPRTRRGSPGDIRDFLLIDIRTMVIEDDFERTCPAGDARNLFVLRHIRDDMGFGQAIFLCAYGSQKQPYRKTKPIVNTIEINCRFVFMPVLLSFSILKRENHIMDFFP